MRRFTRRNFIQTSTAGAAALAATAARPARARPAAAASQRKYVVGFVGSGGRGKFLMDFILQRGDVEIRHISDVDSAHAAEGAALVEKLQKTPPRLVEDYRAMLDDKDVHAVFVATPDHWHALPTIHACQAGKDVYVEKPASHNLWEGRQMVKAARKYQRVVQLGTQTRSGDYTHAAAEYIRSGQLGHVNLVRVINMKEWERVMLPPNPPPQGVDYDRWLGAAPKRAFDWNHFHGTWHLWWDYSGGDIINDGVHQIDAARYLVGKVAPRAVSCTGGKYAREDRVDAPNTQVVTWDFGDMTMVFELAINAPYMEKMPWELRDGDTYPDWTWDGMRIEVFGNKNFMFFERHGGGWQAFAPGRKKIAERNDRHPHIAHIQNFFECVESRKRPNADIEEGHLSTSLCHLGNISYRVGGRRLEWDAKAERFVNDPDADKLLKRVYREPYVVPEQV